MSFKLGEYQSEYPKISREWKINNCLGNDFLLLFLSRIRHYSFNYKIVKNKSRIFGVMDKGAAVDTR